MQGTAFDLSPNQLQSHREGSGLPLPTTDNSLNQQSLVSAASRAKSALHPSHCWSAAKSIAIDVLLDHTRSRASYSPPLHPSTYGRNSAPPFSHPGHGGWVSARWGKSCLSTTHSTRRERKRQSRSRLLWRGGSRARATTPTSFMQSRNWPDNLPDTELVMKLQPRSCRELHQTASKPVPFTGHWAGNGLTGRHALGSSAGARTKSPKLLQLQRGREHPIAQTMHSKGILLNTHTSTQRNCVEFIP